MTWYIGRKTNNAVGVCDDIQKTLRVDDDVVDVPEEAIFILARCCERFEMVGQNETKNR
jgi:hypothetical protein